MSQFQNIFYEQGIFSHLDLHFAEFLTGLSNGDGHELFLAASLVSSYKARGHICLDLSAMAGKPLLTGDDDGETLICPELGKWREKIEKSPVLGKPGEYRPLILDNSSRLYLYRYWEYQQKLVNLIKTRVNDDKRDIDIQLLKQGLDRLFPANTTKLTDWQKIAAYCSIIKRVCVISGGPGTGKTTTVAKIIALTLEQVHPEKIRTALAAPTGKAAARLQETIKAAKDQLNCSDTIKDAIPENASTIHRLLGSIPGSPYFRHNPQHKLPIDVLVVDEVSMVDLALMSKLVQALPSDAQLILLGDKDQLASVEAGAVLGDICDSGNAHGFSRRFWNDLNKVFGYELDIRSDEHIEPGICDCIVQLRKSYRFSEQSGIGALSRAVNAGDKELSIKLLKQDELCEIERKDTPEPGALSGYIKERIVREFAAYLEADDPGEAFELFDRFRILCALREGPFGVVAVNLLLEKALKDTGLIEPGKTWYEGRPVLITSNDYNLNLFNGDVGIVLQDPEAGNDLRVFFPSVDGTLRKLHPLRLPECETVYAMTIHKSQGSEFDKVLVLLSDRDSPIMTRELIYTGITRAKKSVEIWGDEDIFSIAVSRRIERGSGLRDALWGHNGCWIPLSEY
ncbi:MAG: exodeoxyribonuclease V subunit alpha [Desulfobacterales bacterium]|nr:exodeoxyribonuclease V subunit alpha [Desulfobacterales bacterium]